MLQIDRCRPYFVCLLGERYGWAHREGVTDALLDASFTYAIQNFPDRFDWIQNYRIGTSVTMVRRKPHGGSCRIKHVGNRVYHSYIDI